MKILPFARKNPCYGIRRVTSVEQLAQNEKKTLECFKPELIAKGGELPISFRFHIGSLCTNGGIVYIKYRGRLFFTPSGWAKSITGLSNSGWDNCRIGQDDVPQKEWRTLNKWYAEYQRKPPTERPCKKRRIIAKRQHDEEEQPGVQYDEEVGVAAFLTPDQEQKWIDKRLAEIEKQ